MKRIAVICLAMSTLTGCQSLLHELQPHRLWRWNYQDAPGRTEGAYFSISDPLDSMDNRDELKPYDNVADPIRTGTK